jgi:hypothetical protein
MSKKTHEYCHVLLTWDGRIWVGCLNAEFSSQKFRNSFLIHCYLKNKFFGEETLSLYKAKEPVEFLERTGSIQN